LRPIAKIQVDAAALAGSNRSALRHTKTIVSCASSSAAASAMPERRK
jgi:hypothetical protein